MSYVIIHGSHVSDLSDEELISWMQETKGGYKLQKKTASIWVAVYRSLDQQGPPMTVRGLFYNCENVHHVVGKSEAGYQQVQRQVLAMRQAKVLRYDFISDSTRWIRKPKTYSGMRAFLEHGITAYRRALWENQNAYVLILCEKDAIAGILDDVTEEYDVPLIVVRGYPSETLMFNVAQDIKSHNKPAYVYYFGDWDEHGVQISNNIEKKLAEFGAVVQFERVAVLPQQILEWKLPTRPSKHDKKKIDWGECVEVDAIPANKLRELAEDCILRHMDPDEYQRSLRTEELERESYERFIDNWGLVSHFTSGSGR